VESSSVDNFLQAKFFAFSHEGDVEAETEEGGEPERRGKVGAKKIRPEPDASIDVFYRIPWRLRTE
jgi:hypothetical protein